MLTRLTVVIAALAGGLGLSALMTQAGNRSILQNLILAVGLLVLGALALLLWIVLGGRASVAS
jgi:hypothetical protein